MHTKLLIPTVLFLIANALACSSSGGSSPASSPASDGSGTGADGSGTTADAGGTTVTTASAGTTTDGSGTAAVDTSTTTTTTTTTATAETATKLVFSSAVLVAATGDCSAVSVQTQDATGAAANLLNDHSIAFTSSATTGAFYSDADCTAAASSLALATGANAGTLYYADSAAGTPTVTATDSYATPLAAASQIETITDSTTTGTSGSLAFTNSTLNQAVGSCGMLTLSVYNTTGALSPLTAALQVTLTSSSGSGVFYTDASCTANFTTANLPVGLQTTNIYYKDGIASSPVITASSASGAYSAATQTETISGSSTSAGMSTIDFISPSATSYVSRCVSTPFAIHNSLGQLSYFTTDVVIGLTSSTSAAAFFTDSGCQNRVSAVTIPHGLSNFTLYYYSNLPNLNVLTVTPQVGGIGTTSQNLYLHY